MLYYKIYYPPTCICIYIFIKKRISCIILFFKVVESYTLHRGVSTRGCFILKNSKTLLGGIIFKIKIYTLVGPPPLNRREDRYLLFLLF